MFRQKKKIKIKIKNSNEKPGRFNLHEKTITNYNTDSN